MTTDKIIKEIGEKGYRPPRQYRKKIHSPLIEWFGKIFRRYDIPKFFAAACFAAAAVAFAYLTFGVVPVIMAIAGICALIGSLAIQYLNPKRTYISESKTTVEYYLGRAYPQSNSAKVLIAFAMTVLLAVSLAFTAGILGALPPLAVFVPVALATATLSWQQALMSIAIGIGISVVIPGIIRFLERIFRALGGRKETNDPEDPECFEIVEAEELSDRLCLELTSSLALEPTLLFAAEPMALLNKRKFSAALPPFDSGKSFHIQTIISQSLTN